jgi:hypothetical protein
MDTRAAADIVIRAMGEILEEIPPESQGRTPAQLRRQFLSARAFVAESVEASVRDAGREYYESFEQRRSTRTSSARDLAQHGSLSLGRILNFSLHWSSCFPGQHGWERLNNYFTRDSGWTMSTANAMRVHSRLEVMCQELVVALSRTLLLEDVLQPWAKAEDLKGAVAMTEADPTLNVLTDAVNIMKMPWGVDYWMEAMRRHELPVLWLAQLAKSEGPFLYDRTPPMEAAPKKKGSSYLKRDQMMAAYGGGRNNATTGAMPRYGLNTMRAFGDRAEWVAADEALDARPGAITPEPEMEVAGAAPMPEGGRQALRDNATRDWRATLERVEAMARGRRGEAPPAPEEEFPEGELW